MKSDPYEIDGLSINEWPEDWDLHIAKSFQTHLSDNHESNLSFETAIFMTERIVSEAVNVDRTTVRIVFKIQERRWLGVFKYDGEFIYGDIAYVIAMVPARNDEVKAFHAYPEGKSKMYTAIKTPIGTIVETEKMTFISEVESLILKDYWDRNGDDDDNSEDEPDNSPDPVKSLDLNPIIIGV